VPASPPEPGSARIWTLRCHHCSRYLGEAPGPRELVGLVKEPSMRELIAPPRDSRPCKACGWTNIFQPLDGPVAAA